MSVCDVGTQNHGGRTWFGYPIPDDYSVGRLTGKYVGLDDLDPPGATPLPKIGQGYPWLAPEKHNEKPTTNRGPGAIGAIGLRWQSLVVTPEKIAGLELPAVDSDSKYKWWKRLRDVKSSFVANKNETEKFVYYDGPTTAESPAKFEYEHPKLKCIPQRIFPNDFDSGQDELAFKMLDKQMKASALNAPQHMIPKKFAFDESRKAFLIRVVDQEVQGIGFDLRVKKTFDFSDTKTMNGDATRAAMLGAICEAGLNESEANGLLDCWAPQFFETPGQRVVFLLSREEYDKMCPLKVRPTPTEFARVGLVLTELNTE